MAWKKKRETVALKSKIERREEEIRPTVSEKEKWKGTEKTLLETINVLNCLQRENLLLNAAETINISREDIRDYSETQQPEDVHEDAKIT